MNDAVAIVVNAALAAILMVSGVLKLTALDRFRVALTRLRLPAVLATGPFGRVWPWCEMVLGLAVVVLPAPASIAASVAVVATTVGFLVIAARAQRHGDRVSCACFGALSQAPLGAASIARNAGLVGLAVVGLVAASQGSVVEHLVHLVPEDRGLLQLAVLGLAALAVLRLIDHLAARDAGQRDGNDASRQSAGTGDHGTGDRGARDHGADSGGGRDVGVHSRALPAVMLTDLFGAAHDVRRFVGADRTVLIFLSTTCASCRALAEEVATWRTALAAQGVTLRAVTAVPASRALTSFPTLGAFLHHDPDNALAHALGVRTWPAAVYVGGEGTPTVTQGPAFGAHAITALIDNLRVTEALAS